MIDKYGVSCQCPAGRPTSLVKTAAGYACPCCGRAYPSSEPEDFMPTPLSSWQLPDDREAPETPPK